jgi:hypothetical protein
MLAKYDTRKEGGLDAAGLRALAHDLQKRR